MAIFQSSEQLYAVLDQVFTRVTANPDNIAAFTHSNLVIRLRTTEPEAEVLLDGRQPPLEVFYGPRPGKANLEVLLQADLLHAIWIGKQSASQAFFGGQVKTQGNLLKAAQLIELFRECERVYAEVAQANQLV